MSYQQSEDISKISEALSKAQGAMQGAAKDSKNPFFKSDYADLASVIFSIKGPLAENGLAFVQFVGNDDKGWPEVTTQLSHKSGQWMRNSLSMQPKKNDPQGMGSAITYARRYSLASMVGIPQVDDDAESSMDRRRPQAKSFEPAKRSSVKNQKRVDKKRPQVKDIKDKSLYTLEDAKDAFDYNKKTILKRDDFGSRDAFAGKEMQDCQDWQDECVKLAKLKGWRELSKNDQAFAIWANHLKQCRSDGEKKSGRSTREAEIQASLLP